MSSAINALNAQIAELETERDIAQTAHNKARAYLSGNPTDGGALQSARETERRVADINGDLMLLRNSAVAAEAEAQSESRKAIKAEAAAKMRALEQLLAKRMPLARGIDKALVDLKDAVQSWAELNEEIRNGAIAFYRQARGFQATAPHFYGDHGANSDLANSGNNAITSQLEEALRGLNFNHHIVWRFIRNSPTAPELLAVDCVRSGEKLLDGMHGVAKAEELPV